MIVVIDTNVLLPALSTGHPYRVILESWLRGDLIWALTNEVIFEYEEITRRRIGQKRWDDFLLLLERMQSYRQNVLRISPSYRFRLVTGDADDDKFSDCAIAAEADWIITSDHHFNVLNGSGFKPQPISPEGFIERFC